VQIEKEAAIGRLARGVAHEINNPLQGVLGFVQLMIHKARADELDRDLALRSLEMIENSALRCKRIVDALLEFSTREEGAPRVIDVLGLLELNLIILRHDLDLKEVALEFVKPDHPVTVRGNPSQLSQALFNVLANARDAVSQRGSVRVEVRVEEAEVVVTVSDDGPGIPEKNLNRIFDPFFSTKDVGEGTGLGLCVTRGIVRVHRGDIQIENHDAGGTQVRVILPRYRETPDAD